MDKQSFLILSRDSPRDTTVKKFTFKTRFDFRNHVLFNKFNSNFKTLQGEIKYV